MLEQVAEGIGYLTHEAAEDHTRVPRRGSAARRLRGRSLRHVASGHGILRACRCTTRKSGTARAEKLGSVLPQARLTLE